MSIPKTKGLLFLASSLCDGLEDNNIRQVTTLLLNKDADPNVLIPTHGVTPFHLVIGNDSIEFAEEVTKLFLCHGGDPNVRSNDGMTPVHVAAAWGRIDILQLLLANGGNPLCLDNDGYSPFHYAFDGKYFKAVTMLAKYCENIHDEDDKPKYNMVLNKILVTSGDVVGEYVASKDTVLDLDTDNISKNNAFPNFYNHKLTIKSNCVQNIHDTAEIKLKSLKNIDNTESVKDIDMEYPSISTDIITSRWNDSSQADNKEILNCSFIDLDFDLANLHLSDVKCLQKEKCLVSEIINHLSTFASNITINETLHNYKRSKRKRRKPQNDTESNFGMLSQLKENMPHEYRYYKTLEDSTSKFIRHNLTEDSLKSGIPFIEQQYSKYMIQNSYKKRYRSISDRIPLTLACSFDHSIVSMSPNFNTLHNRKRRDTVKSPLLLSRNYCNDSIVSKSPNLATPVFKHKNRRQDIEKISVNGHFSTEICKKSYEYKTQMRYSEFNHCKKHIAQSTPRRKRKSIYKLHSGNKRFNSCWQENDITADEFVTSYTLKPVNLDKTIFSEVTENTNHDTLYSGLVSPLLDSEVSSKIKRQNSHNKNLTMKLDKKKCDENITTHIDTNVDYACMDLNNSFNQMEKEHESFENNRIDRNNTIKSENNEMGIPFITICNHQKTQKVVTPSTSIAMKSICATGSTALYREDFTDYINHDIKNSNKNLDVNINRTCNLYTQNSCTDKFHESLTRLAENDINCKKAEDMFNTKDLNVCEMEKSSSLLSYVSTQEEYKYEDKEKAVILLERRVRIASISSPDRSKCDIKNKLFVTCASSASTYHTLPKELFLIDNITLRRELTQFGDQPGPITNTTRCVYLKRLMHLRNIEDSSIASRPMILQNIAENYIETNHQIKTHLEFGNWISHLDIYRNLEEHIFQEFVSPNPSRRWREGISKTSFTYLLLDPRITRDLPYRSTQLTESEVWSIFFKAIFYIGKGKRSRPFAHLYDAFNIWVSRTSDKTNKKINRILDIWNSDHGVICLHVFQNIIPVEAYTREAAMIDAIGIEWLENSKSGEYYGIAATWNMQQKQEFGRYLLYKALRILLHEGERQLFPQNL